MKKYFKEFKEFAIKGNVIDLAVAVVIGAAFGKIVSSLVADVVMPFISLIAGGVDFSSWTIILRAVTLDAQGEILRPEIVLKAGNFLQNIFDFLVIAISIFSFVKILGRLKTKLAKEAVTEKVEEEKKPEKPSKDQELLTEIRDILKQKKDE